MKIAIITTMGGYPWGGSEFLWAATAEQALIEGHQVFISVYDWSVSHPIVKKLQDLGAYILPRPRAIKSSLLTRAINRLAQPLKKQLIPQISPYQIIFDQNPDVVCISQGGSYDLAYIPDLYQLICSKNIPFHIICQFNSENNPIDTSAKERIRKVFHKSQSVAFVSEHNRKLAEHHLACNLPNSIVVRNPVNLIDNSLVPFPKLSTVSFACVARLEVQFKGQDVLFQVLSDPKWRQRDWQCCLYGSGPDEEYLRSLAKYYKISDRIQFKGHVHEVRSIWAENHILLLPSRGEGTPLSLIEAMLCGRPAVVTDVGGNAEWIEENRTGFIADAPMTRNFNVALERAWLNRDNWNQMGLDSHHHSKSNIEVNPGAAMLSVILKFVKNQ
jgi:L-malate glycosyltransferase